MFISHSITRSPADRVAESLHFSTGCDPPSLYHTYLPINPLRSLGIYGDVLLRRNKTEAALKRERELLPFCLPLPAFPSPAFPADGIASCSRTKSRAGIFPTEIRFIGSVPRFLADYERPRLPYGDKRRAASQRKFSRRKGETVPARSSLLARAILALRFA